MVSAVETELDMAGLGNLSNKTLDQLVRIFFRIRPDTKLAALGLTGQTVGAAVRVMRQARARCIRQFGEGMLGITSDYSNIHDIAASHGWGYAWYLAKPEPRAKAKAIARFRSRSRRARPSGLPAITWGEPDVGSQPAPLIPGVPSLGGNSPGIPGLVAPSPTLVGHNLPPRSFGTEQSSLGSLSRRQAEVLLCSFHHALLQMAFTWRIGSP